MKDIVYERKLNNKIGRFLQRREIIGIRGPRQAGKTTLTKMIYDKITEDKAFINLDLIECRRELEENPLDFVKRFKKSNRLFLFLDEIQRVENGGEKLKIIYDEFPELKVLFSSSSSLELKTKILPFLVGRLFLFELYTFDFEEFLKVKEEGLYRLFKEKNKSLKNFLEDNGEIQPPSFTKDFLKHWKRYAVFGGYPEVIKSENREEKITILKNIHNLYLERDITSFFKVEELSKFQDFLKILSFTTSNLLSLSSVASDAKLSYRRAEEFLEMLVHTYIIHLLKPYHKNLVTEIKKASKLYFLDLGLRNAIINNFTGFDNRSDRGHLLENFIFRELFTNFDKWNLNYWRTAGKAEVDFVLTKKDQIIPIKVKSKGKGITRSLHSFINSYRPEKALVVTLDEFKREKIKGTIIYWIPVFYF